jgi:hypothetical protein
MNFTSINWGSVADWVSGLGSLSAGVIALYLARASQRIRLRGSCGLRIVLSQGVAPCDILSVSATNIGTRATVISNIGLRVGVFRKKYAIITTVKDLYSVGIPYPLADGQEGHWGIPLDQEKTWIRDLCKDLVKNKTDVWSLRFQIHTSHGESITIRPEKNLRRELLNQIKAKNG